MAVEGQQRRGHVLVHGAVRLDRGCRQLKRSLLASDFPHVLPSRARGLRWQDGPLSRVNHLAAVNVKGVALFIHPSQSRLSFVPLWQVPLRFCLLVTHELVEVGVLLGNMSRRLVFYLGGRDPIELNLGALA